MALWWIAALGTCIGVGAGLLGVGTSIFTVVVFAQLARLPLGSAVTTSLVVVAFTSAVALVPYSCAGAVRWRAGLAFSLISTAGAFLGGRVASWLPARALLAVFAAAMAAAAIAMLWKRQLPLDGIPRASKRSLLVMAAAALPLGGLTGVVGLGGGFAVLPLLVLCADTPIRAAVGTTLLVVVLNTLASLAGHLPHPAIHWRLACVVGLAASAGSLAGARLAGRMDTHALKRICGALLLVLAAATFAKVLA